MMIKQFLFLAVLLSSVLNAQTGTVTYLKSVFGQLENKDFSTATAPYNQIGQDRSFILYFNKHQSIFKNETSLDNEAETSFTSNKKDTYYVNLKTKESLHQQEFLGDVYLINNNFKNNWTLTKESKQIGIYQCFKAVLLKETKGVNNKITVWYTPKISTTFGPIGLHGLPGLILEYSKTTIKGNNISVTRYFAKKIKLNTNKKITKPVKGIAISQQAFFKKRRDAFLALRKKYRRK